MAILPTKDAIVRFDENEDRLNTFINSYGTYTPNSGLPAVETIPSFMQRAATSFQLYTTTNPRGSWQTSTAYQVKDIVQSSGTWYICLVAHTSGTFATDLSSKYWAVYQGLTTSDLNNSNGASLVGVSADSSYPIGTVGNELTKHGRSDDYVLDDFFRFTETAQLKPIFIVGDSISEGASTLDYSKDSWASIVQKAVQKRANNRNQGFANFNFAAFEGHPEITFPHKCVRSGFSNYPFNGSVFGGCMVQSTTAGDYIEINFTGKDAYVVYIQEASGTVLNVTLDGVSVGAIDTKAAYNTNMAGYSASGGGYSAVISASKWGNHTLRLTNSQNNSAKLCGMVYMENSYNSSLPSFGTTLFNVGRSSLTLNEIPTTLLQAYATSGTVILALGVNDDLGNLSTTTFANQLDTILGTIASYNGSAIVPDFIFSKPQSNPYKTLLRQKARQYGFPYLDFSRMWAGASVADNKTIGYLSPDGVHPTAEGHAFIAATICRVMGIPYDKGVQYNVNSLIVSPTFNSNWVNLGVGGYSTLGVSKSPNGLVQLKGVVKPVATASSYSTICTLPSGYAPSEIRIFPVSINHTFGEVEVHPDGTVVAVNSVTAGYFVSLDSITYQI